MSLRATTAVRFHRAWAMPSADTFSIRPIKHLLRRHLVGHRVIVDPFARNAMWGTHRNDLNPDTAAQWHLDAPAFCELLQCQGVTADAVLFDPPYSPRQVADCYQRVGRVVGKPETQNAKLNAQVKDGLAAILRPDGIAICCGWNSGGFGKGRGFALLEVLVVCHGGAHNDTLVTVEKKERRTPVSNNPVMKLPSAALALSSVPPLPTGLGASSLHTFGGGTGGSARRGGTP